MSTLLHLRHLHPQYGGTTLPALLILSSCRRCVSNPRIIPRSPWAGGLPTSTFAFAALRKHSVVGNDGSRGGISGSGEEDAQQRRYSKARSVPPGMTKGRFLNRLKRPGGHKPWMQARGEETPVVASSADIETVFGGMTGGGNGDHDDDDLPLGVTPTRVAPSSPRSSVAPSQDLSDGRGGHVPPGEEEGADDDYPVALREGDDHHARETSLLAQQQRYEPFPSDAVPVTGSVGFRLANDNDGSSSLSAGTSKLEVPAAATAPSGSIPLALHTAARSVDDKHNSIAVPKHLRRLLQKIRGLREDVGELDDSTGLSPRQPAAAASMLTRKEQAALSAMSDDEAAPLLRKKVEEVKTGMQYGVLTQEFENDDFAKKNKLALAGRQFERKFMQWAGVSLLDQSPGSDLEEASQHRLALVTSSTPGQFQLPKINRDPCPGCGATLQDKDEGQFGYCSSHEVMRWIEQWQHGARLRAEYAERMHELMKHWEKHGKRVGEEWLDFMTQEEFSAIYRAKNRPFTCRRCVQLHYMKKGTEDLTLSAPDFSEKLKALKEKKCVIVLVVDLSDFPGSMVHDLPGLISMNNKVIIAANKLDIVSERNFNYSGRVLSTKRRLLSKRYVSEWVRNIATKGNFKLPEHQVEAVVPVSAHKRWNIDELIVTIEKAANLTLSRPTKPLPVYFVGTTNVGKSSLLNTIAERLFVPQPPHPNAKKVFYTVRDPKTGRESVHYRWTLDGQPLHMADMNIVRSQRNHAANRLLTTSALPGTTVNAVAIRLRVNNRSVEESNQHLTGSSGKAKVEWLEGKRKSKSTEDDPPPKSYGDVFFFDTPGINPRWMDTTPLTQGQIVKYIQKQYKQPVCMVVHPGYTVFFSGLVAIDVVKGPPSLLFAVYANQKVKTWFCPTDVADETWQKNIGGNLQPPGSPEQLGDLRLTSKKQYLFECYGNHVNKTPKVDIYVSGLGWVSFWVSEAADVVLRVRTVPGVVHGLRQPLRYKDMRIYRPWPRLPAFMRPPKARSAADNSLIVRDVVQLVAKPVTPEDQQEPLMKELPKPMAPPSGRASSVPYDMLVRKLREQGHVVDTTTTTTVE